MALGRDQKLHILDLTRSKVQQRGVGAGPSLSKSCQIMQSGSTSQRVLWLESVVEVQFYLFTRVLKSELLALKPVKLCKAKRDSHRVLKPGTHNFVAVVSPLYFFATHHRKLITLMRPHLIQFVTFFPFNLTKDGLCSMQRHSHLS